MPNHEAGREPDSHDHACWWSARTAVCTAATASTKGTALPHPPKPDPGAGPVNAHVFLFLSFIKEHYGATIWKWGGWGVAWQFVCFYSCKAIFFLPTKNCVHFISFWPLQCPWTIWGYILHSYIFSLDFCFRIDQSEKRHARSNHYHFLLFWCMRYRARK